MPFLVTRSVVGLVALTCLTVGAPLHAGAQMPPGGEVAPPSLGGAQQAYAQNRIGEAERAYRTVLDSSGDGRSRAVAARGLARIAWLGPRDVDAARDLLGHRYDGGAEDCANAIALARFLRAAGRSTIVDAPGSPDPCRGFRGQGDQLRAELILGDLEVMRRQPELAARARAAAVTLERGLSHLSDLVPAIQAVRLELAVAVGDAARAVAAWRRFGVAGTRRDDSLLFSRGLAARATLADRSMLLDRLARAGFRRAAGELLAIVQAAPTGPASPTVRSLAACTRFEQGVETAAEGQYRRMIGVSNRKTYDSVASELADRLTALYTAANGEITDWSARKPSDGPIYAVNQRCGITATFAFTGGFPGVHMGHAISSVRRTVRDDVTHAEVRFDLIDNMVTNGFQSWLWDGDRATGGWSGGGGVTQVRGPYIRRALEELALATADAIPSPDRESAATRSSTDSAIRYLPDVEHQLAGQVAASVARQVGRGRPDFAEAFVARYLELDVEHAVWLHEGRHALDQARYKGDSALSAPEQEYRAKLSELAWAAMPRDAFASINDATVGDASPHGIANQRVLAGYREWIRGHGNVIGGYDSSESALRQLPRLSDDQIRDAARALLHECCADYGRLVIR